MTDIQREQLDLSVKWKKFQLYSVQFACGALSSYWILSLEVVEKAFTKASLSTFHALFLVGVIIVGVLSIFCSGGIGLLRLINAKRVLQMIDKEKEDDK